MTVETATYVSQLDATLPAAGDQKSEGDDHFRLIKTVLKTQFPNFGTVAVTPTAVELNYVAGVTSAIQTQLDGKTGLNSPTFTGTPAGPTAAAGTNTTQLSTTAFAMNMTSPAFLGTPTAPTAAPGTSTTQLATTAFAASLAFSTALPGISLTTKNLSAVNDGSVAGWGISAAEAMGIFYYIGY